MKELIKVQDKNKINTLIKKMHPFDILQELKKLSKEEVQTFYSLIDKSDVARILAYLDSEEAADIIDQFDLKYQKEILNQMELDDVADILIHLENQDEVLKDLLDKKEIENVLLFSDSETGSHMSDAFIELNIDMDIKEATKKVIKEAAAIDNINYLFVSENGKYIGAIELRKLIKTKAPALISDIVSDYPYVYDYEDITNTIYKIKDYGVYEMPVLNKEMKIIGIITLDDAIDFYHETATEDFEKLAALPDTETKGILKSAINRLPWLIMLLVLSIPIALATTRFEHVIASVAVLALFQPLILDAGGDVATQTLAVTLRILNKDKKKAFTNGMKEIITGTINGVFLGIVAAIISYFLAYQMNLIEPFNVALVVGLSLSLTVITGPVFGFLIPITLDKLKIDPAVASGPFITTFIDVTSVFIYFGLASLLLGVL